MEENITEANQLYHELHNVIRRFRIEGDKLTTFEIIGALEAVKCDVMDSLAKHNKEKSNGE